MQISATSSYATAPAPRIAPETTTAAATATPSTSSTTQLSNQALALIDQLKSRDLEVRQHEQAHMAAAGGLATSGASYTYQRGPNGIDYAIGGEVNIDTSPGATPEETIARARAVQSAALAPAEPSGADRAVAAQAQQMEMQARAELAQRAYGDGPAVRPRVDTFA
ncbi:catalase [Duganella sp. sic0402]|uniref:putative metalloprotease CJM1_0395 family protein n=1 Tax=Duganella sp. sic0402 TaxID=2854786 RepID=UPI001C43A54B|nr:putative metalloprotease CJM1_0395 family protein [Duganella sp. sic0402]MBV7535268.1 catalase [Duganella sp. sic0402]